jgi:predicted nucleic acid-binding Zn ribbon protein
MKIFLPGTRLMPKVCTICGVKYIGNGSSLYCPLCRVEKKKEYMRRWRERSRAGKAVILGETKGRCEVCGQEFVYSAGGQKYCSDCAEEAYRKNQREKARGWIYRAVEKYGEQYREDRNASYRSPNTKCRLCGANLPEEQFNFDYCDECRSLRRRYSRYKKFFKESGHEGNPLSYEEWLRRESKYEIIRKWRNENPDGTGADCVKDTGIGLITVRKYWRIINAEEGVERNFVEIRTCPICGKQVPAAKSGKRLYCSPECAEIMEGYQKSRYRARNGCQKSLLSLEDWIKQHKK